MAVKVSYSDDLKQYMKQYMKEKGKSDIIIELYQPQC